jgi:hypothetical protein
MKLFKLILILSSVLIFTRTECLAQSKEELFNRDATKLVRELRLMLVADQQYRGSGEIADSNIAHVKVIDDANTRRMMVIIKTYGFPSRDRTARLDNDLAAFILLMHAPEKYFEALKPLLKTELDVRRISSFEYAQVMWHLNGRVGVPAM